MNSLTRSLRFGAAALAVLSGAVTAQRYYQGDYTSPPLAEFHMARMVYSLGSCSGWGGGGRPWWAIDYPSAEAHILPAIERLTGIETTLDSRFIELTDDALFDFPWLFVQQVGRGCWRLSEQEVRRLREYLLRGGFLVVDDFHSDYEWPIFEEQIRRVLPEGQIVELPDTDPLLHVFYDVDKRTQIPGERHLRSGMEGPPHWRAIYDDAGRIMVAINFNMDMGDAWEHADDAHYPEPMTALAYRFGVNYVIYAMTH